MDFIEAGSYDREVLLFDQDLQKLSILCSTFTEGVTLLISTPGNFQVVCVHITENRQRRAQSLGQREMLGQISSAAGLLENV